MKNRCISMYFWMYGRIHHPRPVPRPPYAHTAYTAYTFIQLYSVYIIHPHTASLWALLDTKVKTGILRVEPESVSMVAKQAFVLCFAVRFLFALLPMLLLCALRRT